MKSVERLFYIASIIVLAILLLRECDGDTTVLPKPTRTTKVSVKYLPLTKIEKEFVYVPTSVRTYTALPKDTTGLSKLCYTIMVYDDTLSIDTNLTIYTRDSVRGKLLEKKVSYSYRPYIKEVIITHTDSIPYKVIQHKNGFYVGAGFHYINNNLYSNLGIKFVDKKDNIFGIGTDPLNYVNNKQVSLFIDYHRRIKIRK